MFFFQSIKRILIRRGKLLNIRISLRKIHRHRHGSQIQISLFPFYKFLIRSRQIIFFHITCISCSVPVQKHLIPDYAVFVGFHPCYLYGLPADRRLNCLAVRRRSRLYLIGITQINGRKNRFRLYDFLKTVFGLLRVSEAAAFLWHFNRYHGYLYTALPCFRKRIQRFVPPRIKKIAGLAAPFIIFFTLPCYGKFHRNILIFQPHQKHFRKHAEQFFQRRLVHTGIICFFLRKRLKCHNVFHHAICFRDFLFRLQIHVRRRQSAVRGGTTHLCRQHAAWL